VAELFAIVALGAQAAVGALGRNVAELATVEAFLTTGRARLLGVLVLRLRAVTGQVLHTVTVPARLHLGTAAATACTTAASATTRARPGILLLLLFAVAGQVADSTTVPALLASVCVRAIVVRALASQMVERTADVAGLAGLGLGAIVIWAVPTKMVSFTTNVTFFGRSRGGRFVLWTLALEVLLGPAEVAGLGNVGRAIVLRAVTLQVRLVATDVTLLDHGFPVVPGALTPQVADLATRVTRLVCHLEL